MQNNLLSILDLDTDELLRLVDYTIDNLDADQSNLLKGKNIGIYFDRPSTRTRTSFTLAAANLGASVVTYQPNEIQVTTGETWEDTSRVLAEYLDLLVMRIRTVDDAKLFAEEDGLAVINALTDEEHPSQAMADLVTLKQCFGKLEGLHLLFMGDGGNIATSLALSCSRIPNMTMTLICPEKYGLKPEVLDKAQTLAKASGATINYHNDPNNLPKDVDAVYTTRWRSMGEDKPDDNWLSNFDGFQVTKELLESVAHEKTIMMHDLPAERGAEVDFGVLEDDRSVIFQQAKNKHTTAKTIMAWCCGVV